MESGFTLELDETIHKNCFIHSSYYKNGNLRLSLFEYNSQTNETMYLIDITLEQNRRILKENEVIVDCKFKPTLVTQLLEVGILKRQIGVCAVNCNIYPIYTIDFSKIFAKQYSMQELVAA